MDSFRKVFKIRQETMNCDESNGLILRNVGIPEEILVTILSYVDIKYILKCKLVCKKWNEVIKSHHLWRKRLSGTQVKVKNEIPWYVYYYYFASKKLNTNLLKNGNGQLGFKHWTIVDNGGDEWLVEDCPAGAQPLPENQLEFYGSNKCFATSFSVCSKYQKISFKRNPVLKRIFDVVQPKIYVSEWFTGRFDCACRYNLTVRLFDENGKKLLEKSERRTLEQWSDPPWSKVEIICENYGPGLSQLTFYHEGADRQFWAGHYGSKMTGGVVKVLF